MEKNKIIAYSILPMLLLLLWTEAAFANITNVVAVDAACLQIRVIHEGVNLVGLSVLYAGGGASTAMEGGASPVTATLDPTANGRTITLVQATIDGQLASLATNIACSSAAQTTAGQTTTSPSAPKPSPVLTTPQPENATAAASWQNSSISTASAYKAMDDLFQKLIDSLFGFAIKNFRTPCDPCNKAREALAAGKSAREAVAAHNNAVADQCSAATAL